MRPLLRRLLASGIALGTCLWCVSALAVSASPDDPYFASGDQWALTGVPASINAPSAWCVSTGAGAVVADIDTGADFNHPDLGGKLIVGAEFLTGRGDPSQPDSVAEDLIADDNGHGTMTAGIIGAVTGNGTGIAAVAPDAKVLVIKAIAKDQSGNAADIAAAIRYAADHGANVVNLGLGPEVVVNGSAAAIVGAIDYATSRGTAVAMAAGNSSLGLSADQIAHVEEEALVVGALGPDGDVAHYSTRGPGVNIYAPGGDSLYRTDIKGLVITTMMGGGYVQVEGSAFATSHVSGALALLMAHGLSESQARAAILDTSTGQFGFPQLNAARAVGAKGSCPAYGGVLGETANRSDASNPIATAAPQPHPRAAAQPAYALLASELVSSSPAVTLLCAALLLLAGAATLLLLRTGRRQ